jgi:hypothetical protein
MTPYETRLVTLPKLRVASSSLVSRSLKSRGCVERRDPFLLCGKKGYKQRLYVNDSIWIKVKT